MLDTGKRQKTGVIGQSKAHRRAPPERAEPLPPPSNSIAAAAVACDHSGRRCPCCETVLADIAETATPSDLARRGILAIGTAECAACGQGWIYADFGDDTEASAVRAALGRISKCVLSHNAEGESVHGA